MERKMSADSMGAEKAKKSYVSPAVMERGDFASTTNGSGSIFKESSGFRLRW